MERRASSKGGTCWILTFIHLSPFSLFKATLALVVISFVKRGVVENDAET